jgi:hypothetical protein
MDFMDSLSAIWRFEALSSQSQSKIKHIVQQESLEISCKLGSGNS